MKKSLLLRLAAIFAGVSCSAEEMSPAEREARSINAGKSIATRNLQETISGANVDFFERISGLDARNHFSSLKSDIAASRIRGMRFATEYDKKRDLAIIHAEIDVKEIVDLAPAWKKSTTQVIRRVGFASCTPSTVKQLETLRAAELDAYSKLLAEVIAMDLTSKTTIKNMMLENDEITSQVVATLCGARMIVDPNDQDRITWSDNSENATCTVTLELNLDDFANSLGVKFAKEAKLVRKKGIGVAKKVGKKAVVPVKVVEKEKVVYVEKPVIMEREPATRPTGSKVLSK